MAGARKEKPIPGIHPLVVAIGNSSGTDEFILRRFAGHTFSWESYTACAPLLQVNQRGTDSPVLSSKGSWRRASRRFVGRNELRSNDCERNTHAQLNRSSCGAEVVRTLRACVSGDLERTRRGADPGAGSVKA